MKALCICEKPSLMREIKSVYDKISFKDQIDFFALHGHVLTLKTPEDYDAKYKSWDKSLLPIFPEKWSYRPTDTKLIKELESMIRANGYDYLINATDAEREGQNIFYSVYDYLGLMLPVKRIWLNDLNFAPIKNAIENMRDDLHEPFLVNLTKAAKNRAYSDWLVGMNFSRATGIRVGRVKTPTLEILYKRELEIKNFVPETHYLAKADAGFELVNDIEHKTKKDCLVFIDQKLYKNSSSVDATVTKYESKDVKEYAPLLFSLGELQAEANKQFGYTLAETLETAQSLYEKKITTYPRTDCPYLPTGDAKRIPGMINLMMDIIGMTPKLVTKDLPSRYVDDSKVQAHGAIILTGSAFNIETLNEREQNVVKLIAKRILATMMGPIVTNKVKAEIDICGYKFSGNGSCVLDKGFSELYGTSSKNKLIPSLKVGDPIDIKSILPKEKTSTCPPRYNDATLIKAMINIGNTLSDHEKEILKGTGDQGGIGTPATRAAIVESLLEKNGKNPPWVKRQGKSFHVTEDGMRVGEQLKGYSFASASLTASWEDKLGQIVDGKYDSNVYYNEIKDYVTKETATLVSETAGVSMSSKYETNAKCPKCGKMMKIGKNCYYCAGRADESCDFVVSKEICHGKISVSDLEKILSGGTSDKIKFHSDNKGVDFIASLKLSETKDKLVFDYGNTTSTPSASKNIKCGCGGNVVMKSGMYGEYYECDSCKLRVSKTYAGKKFSDADIAKLYTGKSVSTTFKSKAGKSFKAKVYINNDNKIDLEFLK